MADVVLCQAVYVLLDGFKTRFISVHSICC